MSDSQAIFLEPENERVLWHQKRRRSMIFVGLCFVAWLALLSWLLLHPSSPNSPARRVKNTLFGERVTEAVERATAHGDQEGSGQGQGQGRRGQGRTGQGGTGEEPGQSRQGSQGGVSGTQSGDQGIRGEQAAGSPSAEGDRRGQGTRRQGATSPANPQHPENNGPDLEAPPEHSIGWLDRFFGTQPTAATTIQPGEGGTGTTPGAGNTNISASVPSDVASEFTQDSPPPERVDLARAPALRNTNQPAIAATNATINDQMEQLLNQHHAGRGDLRISLMWHNRNDLDLHVVDPNNEEIYYQHRRARSGGILDIDTNASPPLASLAVENVYWPERGAPAGNYKIFVNHYRKNEPGINATSFKVRVLIKGRTMDFPGSVSFGERKKLVYQFNLAPASGQPSLGP